MSADAPIGLDSAVVIAFVADEEPIASLASSILLHTQLSVILSVITLAEVVTRPAHSGDRTVLHASRAGLLSLPRLTMVDMDQEHAIETAVVRAQTSLRLPDAAIVATARLAGAGALIGNDRQWKHKPLGVPYHHMDDILALG